MPRFLFGPVDDPTFTDRFLTAPCADGRWGTFSAHTPSFERARAGFGPGEPEALLLWTGYTSVPAWVWSVPVPVVALAHDPHVLWHHYRHLLPLADLVLTDAPAAERLRRAGVEQARPGHLLGLDRAFLAAIDEPDGERDIDVLFVGDLNPACRAHGFPGLGRLGALAARYTVAIATGVAGAEYRDLLRRTKLALSFSSHGECPRPALEAAAAGAVLLQEAENEELPAYLAPGHEYVPYTRDDLGAVVARLLAHDHERRELAGRARDRVRGYGFDALIERAVGAGGPDWDAVRARVDRRRADPPRPTRAGRLWQRVARFGPDADPALLDELHAAHEHYALAVLARSPEEAEPHLAACAPGNRVAALGWASALDELGRGPNAIERARAVLSDLGADPLLTAAERDAPPYPARFDALRVGWERARYDHFDDPHAENRAKVALLRFQAYRLLAARTGELSAHEGAAAACPNLPAARSAWGRALARAGRWPESVAHLRFAVEHDPFDRAATDALIAALTETGDTGGASTIRSAHRVPARTALRRAGEGAEPGAPNVGNTSRVPPSPGAPPTSFVDLSESAFTERFGVLNAPAALTGYTPPRDTWAVLTLVERFRPRRVLEVGTAVGQMTANLTARTPPDAIVYSIGLLAEGPVTPVGGDVISGINNQAPELPRRDQFARFLDHFGTAHKALLITADSRNYDFTRLAPLDLAFIDGGHDYDTVRSDSVGVYRALRPGGCLVWHDVPSPVPWVEVERAISDLGFAEPVYRIAGTQVAFLLKGEGVGARTGAESARLELVWEGQFDVLHSLSLVNHQVCAELLARGHDVVLGRGAAARKVGGVPLEVPAALAERVGGERPGAVTVRHRWPPDFTVPNGTGAFVLIQPWEYGLLPRAWVEPILTTVDEVWAYSRFVLDTYVSSGVPEERLALVPPGVDLDRFRPDLPPLPLATAKGTRLLFVGGTIPRKGFDCLLAAYRRAFARGDDVCLVVKEMGADSFYQGQTSAPDVDRFRADPQAPELLYLTGALSEDEMARLYAACAALVHPYRGEGFALPVLEAMACGKPVVVTAGGATDEFVPLTAGWHVPATRTYHAEELIGDQPTVGKPWWLEPDVGALAEILRRVVADGRDREARGHAARRAARGWPWARTASIIEDRVRVLRTRSPIRLRPTHR